MEISQRWEIVYDTLSAKPSRVVGTITKITGNLIEIDNKYLVNADKIIRGTRLDGDSFD